ADLCSHGVADRRSWRRPAEYVLHCARCATAQRNGLDVHADERLPCGALAAADHPPATRCFPVLVRRSPDRTHIDRLTALDRVDRPRATSFSTNRRPTMPNQVVSREN